MDTISPRGWRSAIGVCGGAALRGGPVLSKWIALWTLPPPQKKSAWKKTFPCTLQSKDKADLRGHPFDSLKEFQLPKYAQDHVWFLLFNMIISCYQQHTGLAVVFFFFFYVSPLSLADKWLTVHSKRFHTDKTNSHMIARWFKSPNFQPWKDFSFRPQASIFLSNQVLLAFCQHLFLWQIR